MPGWVKALLVSLLAILVLGTGAVLLPANDGPPPEPPFSETARNAAYERTRALLSDALLSDALLADATAEGAAGTVSLLSTQARALLAPGATSSPSPSAAAVSTAPLSKAAFLSALSDSAADRLADAAKSDGGTARLLAAVGTAQLLESSRLAAAWGLPGPETPSELAATALPSPAAASCPAAPATTVSPSAEDGGIGTGDALAAVVGAEQEAVYVYQVALTRLEPAAAGEAAKDLARHQQLLREAETLARQHCTEPPPREAGYRLPAGFASGAAAALGKQEAAALPAYGELVALSDGSTRRWAMAGLLDAGRRLEAWGSPAGALPGLAVDPAALPELPGLSGTTGNTGGSTP